MFIMFRTQETESISKTMKPLEKVLSLLSSERTRNCHSPNPQF